MQVFWRKTLPLCFSTSLRQNSSTQLLKDRAELSQSSPLCLRKQCINQLKTPQIQSMKYTSLFYNQQCWSITELFFFTFMLHQKLFFPWERSEGIKRNPKLQWKMCILSTVGGKLTVQTGYLKWLRTGLHLCPLDWVLIIYKAVLPLTWTSLDSQLRKPRVAITGLLLTSKW